MSFECFCYPHHHGLVAFIEACDRSAAATHCTVCLLHGSVEQPDSGSPTDIPAEIWRKGHSECRGGGQREMVRQQGLKGEGGISRVSVYYVGDFL